MMNRRNFLAMLSLLGLGLSSARSTHARPSQRITRIYIDESGTPSHSDFTLGFLYCEDASRTKRAISRFRNESSFKLQFKHSANNKFKNRIVTKSLDYFTSNGKLSFQAWVVKKGIDTESVYASLYREGIMRAIKPGRKLIVHYIKRSQNGKRDRRIIDYVSANVNQVEFQQVKNKKLDDLFQFADLLTGSVRFSRTESGAGIDKVKAATISQIEQAFGISKLATFEGTAKKFSITTI